MGKREVLIDEPKEVLIVTMCKSLAWVLLYVLSLGAYDHLAVVLELHDTVDVITGPATYLGPVESING